MVGQGLYLIVIEQIRSNSKAPQPSANQKQKIHDNFSIRAYLAMFVFKN